MRIKATLFSILFLTLSAASVAQTPEPAQDVLNKAYKQAKKEKKKVFLIFHASWCTWCKKMESNMALPEMKPLFEQNYVLAYLDVQEPPKKKDLENPGADEVLKKFKGEKSGIPFFVILDAKGNLLEDSFDAKGDNLGCPASKEEVAEFITMLKNTSKLSEKDLALISEKFIIKK
jgi:thioredoxin-related protein